MLEAGQTILLEKQKVLDLAEPAQDRGGGVRGGVAPGLRAVHNPQAGV